MFNWTGPWESVADGAEHVSRKILESVRVKRKKFEIGLVSISSTKIGFCLQTIAIRSLIISPTQSLRSAFQPPPNSPTQSATNSIGSTFFMARVALESTRDSLLPNSATSPNHALNIYEVRGDNKLPSGSSPRRLRPELA